MFFSFVLLFPAFGTVLIYNLLTCSFAISSTSSQFEQQHFYILSTLPSVWNEGAEEEGSDSGAVVLVCHWTRGPPSCHFYFLFFLLSPLFCHFFTCVWNHQVLVWSNMFFWAHCHLLATRYKCPFKVTTRSCCLLRFQISFDLSLAVSCHRQTGAVYIGWYINCSHLWILFKV